MKTLCIGDSNTYGYDPRSFLGSRYPKEVRWTDRLESLTGYEVINCGVNGMTVPTDGSNLIALITKESPDLIIVMLGGNDLLLGRSAEQTSERMAAFIEAIMHAGDGKQGFDLAEQAGRVLLISPPSFRRGEWVQDDAQIEESRHLGELYRNLAYEKGCMFADADEWDVEISFDGVHFLPAGHIRFASKLTEVETELDLMGEVEVAAHQA